jgi:hypothetical protein
MPEGTYVVDTNVILVAGGKHSDVSPSCVAACARRLKSIVDSGRIALDAEYEVLSEYQNKTSPNHAKGPGDAFVKWALQNRTNRVRCDLIPLDHGFDGDYVAFPQHPGLVGFDPSDRKFVAISNAHPKHPPILEAADSKWLDWNEALLESGIHVDFVCPEDLERFRSGKLGA